MTTHHPLRILIVDDLLDNRTKSQQTLREQIEAVFQAKAEVELDFATTVRLANAKVRDNFYHAVVADHDLSPGYGMEVLQKVRDLRPSCLRVLITMHPETDAEGAEYLYQNLLPPEPLAHLFVTRTICHYAELVERLISCLPPDRVTLRVDDGRGAEPVDSDEHPLVRAIIGKFRTSGPLPRWAEILHVLDRLFAPETLKNLAMVRDVAKRRRAPTEIDALELKELTGGRSSSTVLRCVPLTGGGGHRGSVCVLKIGPRSEMHEEIERYHLYVRFYRSSVRRVEMLSSQLGDTIGAVCYSFAGGGAADIKPLEDLLKAEDLRTIIYLRHEFSLESREWYRQVEAQEHPAALATFFEKTHKVRVAEQLGAVARLAEEAGVPIKLRPVPEIAAQVREIASHTCIIHGDLNAGNLLLDVDPHDVSIAFDRRGDRPFWAACYSPEETGRSPRTIMIDYRHTARGPVFIDLAALQASLRMLPGEVDNFTDYAGAVGRERDVWAQGWSGTPVQYRPAEDLGRLPYWGLLSHELIRLGRLNFESTQADPGRKPMPDIAWQREYAATCLLYGLRLFKIQALGSDIVPDLSGMGFKDLRRETRLRFACWILAMCEIICPS